jgi:hypothetical protein
MKKFMLALMTVAMMILVASPLFAEGMTFGVKGGLNLANVTGDDAEDASMKIGAVGGVFMCYDITEIFALQPELLFTMKGAKSDEEGSDESWKTNYIEIPVLFRVNLPTEGKIKPMLYAGPALGILLSAELEDVDMKDYMKSYDIGVLAGAGIGYQMEKGQLFCEVRYEVGMTTVWDFSEEELDEDEENPDMKNSVISFMVGYGFAF